MADWNKAWKEGTGTIIGMNIMEDDLKLVFSIMKECYSNSSVIDFGCGTGHTLRRLREYGFINSIGIDNSTEALKICERNDLKIGSDVFLVGDKTDFKDGEFDIVFSVGMLEHYKDMSIPAKEMARIAKKNIIIVQPTSLTYFMIKLHNGIKRTPYVKEYHHDPYVFINKFKEYGFKEVDVGKSFFNFCVILERSE